MEDLRNSISKQKDLKELRTFLNETFESKNIESKNDLIDYLELTYLPNFKVKIETDNQQFAKYEMSLLTSMYQQAKQRIEFIEKWIVEKKVFKMKESNYIPPIDPTDVKDYNNDFDILKNRKILLFENKAYLKMITQINIDEIYTKSYNSFLFANSDEVTIDGVPFLNKFERLKRMKESYQTVTTNDVKDGFTIIEIDFIKTELENSRFLHCKSFKEEKQLELWIKKLNEKQINPTETKNKNKQDQPKTFEELFYNPAHAEICLSILRELEPPVIDAINNYIGKAKGVFPLWVNVLKNHKPEPLIKHFSDNKVYKDLLNDKVKGLSLTKDASEFRKQYKRLEYNKTELDIKVILSQYSQSGKLGK